ncbi:MAG: PIN/TRAM domain-containing protein [Bacillota bacterium]
MIKKIMYIFSALLGALIGLGIANFLLQFETLSTSNNIFVYVFFGIIFSIFFVFLIPKLKKFLKTITSLIENEISRLDSNQIIPSTIGFVVAMVVALLISNIFKYIPKNLEWLGLALTIFTYIFFGYLGINLPKNYVDTLGPLNLLSKFKAIKKEKELIEKENDEQIAKKDMCPKVVDTSVIIDGRISDIVETGFVEGKLIIPEFVLDELQHIADSSEDLKRKKGRRGLDILRKLRENSLVDVDVSEKDFDNEEVDSKLIKLAQQLDGAVLTNDYNLNKVASVKGVKVLNINELANAVKPVVIPGERFNVDILKKGKGNNQGVGYLDDGTMIVVEGGQKYIGQEIETEVTSVLQTDAGRMIFVKPI